MENMKQWNMKQYDETIIDSMKDANKNGYGEKQWNYYETRLSRTITQLYFIALALALKVLATACLLIVSMRLNR